MQTIKFTENKSERLDKFLTHKAGQYSRTQWQRAVKKGFVLVNDKTVTVHHKLNIGDEISILQEPQNKEFNLPKMDIEIVYECADYVVVNKPSGITVHPDTNYHDNTLIQQLLKKYPEIQNIDPASDRPGIVQRLDKNVSGLMVVARHKKMFDFLKQQLSEHKVYKEYTALVHGNFHNNHGKIEANIERSKKSGKMLVKRTEQTGKKSITEYFVTKQYNYFTLLKIIIKTGRTHQIRTIMRSLDHPIVGDPIYNKKNVKAKIDISRPFLHASGLKFINLENKIVEYNQKLPSSLQSILDSMKSKNDTGKIIIISGTTASGKTTVVQKFLEQTKLPFVKIVTSTTRKKRKGETDGIDYNFLTKKEFEKQIKEKKFLEWAQVHNNYYGTPLSSVQEELNKGNNVILIIDVQGALAVKEKLPEAILIFIKLENFEQIKERIIKRHNGIPKDLDTRLQSAKKELEVANLYNYQIINHENKIDNTVAELNDAINREIL